MNRCSQCGRTFHGADARDRFCSEECDMRFNNEIGEHDLEEHDPLDDDRDPRDPCEFSEGALDEIYSRNPDAFDDDRSP